MNTDIKIIKKHKAHPCYNCKMKDDCYNDNTDVRHMCDAFLDYYKTDAILISDK